MTFKFYKTHRAPDETLGYRYVDLYSAVIREYELKEFPFRRAHIIIRNLQKRDKIERVVTKEGWIRYIPVETFEISKPEFIGVDKSTGHSIYWSPVEEVFTLQDAEGNYIKEIPKIQITIAFSIDTKGHQRLLVEAITSTSISPKDAENIESIETEIQEKLEEAGAFYFTPESIQNAIKIGTEYLSEEKDSEDYPESRINLIYRNDPMQSGKTIDKTYSQFQAEKGHFKTKFGKMKFEGVQIGRPKGQKGLEEF